MVLFSPSPPATRRQIRLVIAETLLVLRSSLEVVLDQNKDITVVGTAADGAEVLDRARTTRPDVVLMNLGLPDLPAVEVVRQLRALPVPPYVLIFTL